MFTRLHNVLVDDSALKLGLTLSLYALVCYECGVFLSLLGLQGGPCSASSVQLMLAMVHRLAYCSFAFLTLVYYNMAITSFMYHDQNIWLVF